MTVQVRSQFLWYNCEIKIKAKTVFYKAAYVNNCKFVRDIWHEEETQFLTFPEYNTKFLISMSWLSYQGLINAIPNRWQSIIQKDI